MCAKILRPQWHPMAYEHTKVIDLKEKGGYYEVTTEKGNVITAKNVVIAKHYPIINAPGYYFLKMCQNSPSPMAHYFFDSLTVMLLSLLLRKTLNITSSPGFLV